MSLSPKTPSPRTVGCLLLGVCVGAASLLYINYRRAGTAWQRKRVPDGKSPTTPTPQPGDILLFYNGRGIDKLITGFTGSPFYHASLYAGDNKTVEANTPGIQCRELRGSKEPFVVVRAPSGKGKAALAWAETQIGDAYDNLDILVIILDRLCRFVHFNYTPRNKFTCGEFVACAFDKVGVHLFPERDLSDVVPGDFAHLLPAVERQEAQQ